jgi:hypothetical protein
MKTKTSRFLFSVFNPYTIEGDTAGSFKNKEAQYLNDVTRTGRSPHIIAPAHPKGILIYLSLYILHIFVIAAIIIMGIFQILSLASGFFKQLFSWRRDDTPTSVEMLP